MQKLYFLVVLFLITSFTGNRAFAQFPYFNSFRTSSTAGITLGDNAKLTSGNGDPVNDGVLRLTDNNFNEKGYCVLDPVFNLTKGLKIEFEYFTWGGNNADGTTFFLFEPQGAFEAGQFGGALGYAQNANNVAGQGMKGGFLAIGMDEYGNFGVASESKNGGFVDQNGTPITSFINSEGAIAVRGGVGPNGERFGPTAYPFIGGKLTGSVWSGAQPHASQVLQGDERFNISTNIRYPNETDAGYRRVRMDIEKLPGANTGFIVNVEIFVGQRGKWIKVLDNVPYLIPDSRIPATLKGGFSASTGAQKNYHEIRNVLITPSAKALKQPVANADAQTILSNQTATISVLNNDDAAVNENGVFEPGTIDLDPTTPAINSSYTVSGKGTFTASSTGVVTFTPESGFTGTVTIDYTFADNYKMTSTDAKITVTVNSPNIAPTLKNIFKSGPEDATLTFAGTDFTLKFSDTDNDALTKVRIVSLPANGTLKLSGTNITQNQEIPAAQLGNITFQPVTNWNGNTSFKWNGNDGTVYAAADSVVFITITPVNDAPTVAAITKSGVEDVTITFTSGDFTSKFSDIDNDALSKIQVLNLPGNGTLKLNNTNVVVGQEIPAAQLASLTFVPNANWNGSTTFNWNGHDGTTYAAASALVTITLTPVNDIPTVATITKSGNEDTNIQFTVADFTSKFTDIDNDALKKIKISTLPDHGALKLNGTNIAVNQEISSSELANIVFVPNSNWNGSTSFKWNGNDGTAYAAADASVDITIIPVNDAPSVSNISKTGPEDAVLTFSSSDFTSKFSDPENDVLTKVRISSLPAKGTLKLNGVTIAVNQEITAAQLADITFTPDADWNGTTSFGWNGFDGNLYAIANALVNITITPVNDLPVVSAIAKSGNEDAVISFTETDFTSKFSDPDGNSLAKIKIGSLPDNGVLKFNGVNVVVNQEIVSTSLSLLTFTPNSNWNGSTSFNWNGYDGASYATLEAPVNITITPVNDLPAVSAITKSGNEDQTITFTALDFTSKFTDVENDPLTKIKIVSLPVTGTLKLNGVNIALNQEIDAAQLANITFTPNSNWNGTASFNWNGHDGTGYALAAAPVNITINAVPDPPVVAAINKTGQEDTPLTFTSLDFTSKFTDPDGDQLNKIKVTSLPVNGTLKLNNVNVVLNQEISNADLGQITFVPNANWNGNTSFNWNGHDGTNYAVADAPVNITINAVNDLPVVDAITKSGTEDITVTFTAADFTSKFTDVDNDALSKIRITSLPANGLLKLNGINITSGQEISASLLANITFVPTTNWNGTTSFNWNGHDGTAYASADAPVTITLSPVDDLPLVEAITKTGTEDTPVIFSLSDFTDKFRDPDGDALNKIKIASLPANGVLKLSGAIIAANQEIPQGQIANITFVPDANWNGNTTFNWNGHDGNNYAGATALVTITINPVNDLPVLTGDSKITPEDTPVSGAVTGTDVDNDPITYSLDPANPPQHGTVVVNANGTYTYTPAANYNGPDSFKINGSDGTGTVSANVTITVTPVNDPPVLAALPKTTPEDTPVNGAVTGTDPEGDPITYALDPAGPPAHGTVTVNPDGTYTYTPGANYNGPDSFKVIGDDGNGGKTTVTVAITVTPVNDLPVLTGDSKITPEDTPVSGAVTGTDVDNDPIAYSLDPANPPQHGTVVVNPNGSYTYTPAANYNGPDSFKINGSDGTGTASATVTITVTPVNDPPVLAALPKTTPEDTPVNGAVTGTDPEGDPITYSRDPAGPPAHGTVIVNPDGTYTYTPAANYNGPDSFKVIGDDGNGGKTTVTVAITVTPVNDLPVLTGDSKITPEDTPVSGAVTGTDVDNDPIAYSLDPANPPQHGTVVVNPNGSYTYTPAANYNGPDSFKINGSDGTGSSSATVTITVTPVNDAPVLTALPKTTPEDTPVNGAVTGTDPEGDPITYSRDPAGPPAHGTVTVNPDGTYTYTPAANYNGPDSFKVIGDDGNGGKTTVVVNITITPVNDRPTVSDFSKVINQGRVLQFSASDFTDHFNDIDNDNLMQIQIQEVPDKGLFKLNGVVVTAGQVILFADLAKLTFEPRELTTSTTFKWTGYDGTDYSVNESLVTINVIKAADPIAANDQADAELNKEITIPILDNDKADPALKLDPGSIEIIANPANGTLRINPDGTVTYIPNRNFIGTDQFSYIVKDELGMVTNTATVTVVVNGFVVPNVFTPNGDGKNDTFVIEGLQNYDNADITVFNRWGNEVYRNPSYQNEWNGDALNPGTYYYILKLRKGSAENVQKGWVLIKR